MKIKIGEIQIKIRIVEEEKLKAIVGLDFGDFIIRGFRIQKSDYENARGEKLWLTPPAYNGGGHWHPLFFMPDKELWAKLEDKILSEYQKKEKEHYAKKLGIKADEL